MEKNQENKTHRVSKKGKKAEKKKASQDKKNNPTAVKDGSLKDGLKELSLAAKKAQNPKVACFFDQFHQKLTFWQAFTFKSAVVAKKQVRYALNKEHKKHHPPGNFFHVCILFIH